MNKRLKVLISLAFSVITFACTAQAVEFTDCNSDRQTALDWASQIAPALIAHLKTNIANELARTDKPYDENTVEKLDKAYKKISCVQEKFSELNFVCKNKFVKGKDAMTLPLIGHKVSIYDSYFLYNLKYRASMLIHEASHKCGTNDTDYYPQKLISLDIIADRQWQNTASTYDWWIMQGFCVPGHGCGNFETSLQK